MTKKAVKDKKAKKGKVSEKKVVAVTPVKVTKQYVYKKVTGKFCDATKRYLFLRIFNFELCGWTCLNNLNVFNLNLGISKTSPDFSKADFDFHLTKLNATSHKRREGIANYFGSDKEGVNVRVMHCLLEAKGFLVRKVLYTDDSGTQHNEWLPFELLSTLPKTKKYIIYVYHCGVESGRGYEAHYLAMDNGLLICDSTKKKCEIKEPKTATEKHILAMCVLKKWQLGMRIWEVERCVGKKATKRHNAARDLLLKLQPQFS